MKLRFPSCVPWLAFLLALALCAPFTAQAVAPEVSVADWHAALVDFVEATGTRQAYTEGERRALLYLKEAYQKAGFTERDGTLAEQWMSAPMPIIRKLNWTQGMSNLIAVKKAKNENADVIIVSAHYDSMSGTAGAKDNGSGVAALLTLARCFAALEPFENTELRFVSFAAEEKGEFGSGYYVAELSEQERERVLAAFNIDLLTLDEGAQNIALSCNTLGGATESGYADGSPEKPAHNRASLAFLQAFVELGGDTGAGEGVTWCIPRHWGDSDHVRFADAGIDAATVCFQGNVLEGGSWPEDMHTPQDMLKPYDMERTQHALNVLCRAIYGLALDHEYGCGLAGD